MTVQQHIKDLIAAQPEPKRADMHELHRLIRQVSPAGKLSFFDGKDDKGKTVANPTIGYGSHTMKYADGTTRDTFQLGMSANTTGISLHIIGVTDKTYLTKHFAKKLGKASITGYCIKFKALKDLNMDVLEEVIQYAFEAQKPS